MTNATAPVKNAATQEKNEELPKTGVKPRIKDAMLQDMSARLAEFAEPEVQEPVNNTSEDETWQKRYGDLRKHTQKQENSYKKQVSDLQTQIKQLTEAANRPMPKSKEEFEAWKAQYPDIIPFIEMVADEKASARAASLEEKLKSVTEQLGQTQREKNIAVLTKLVPDWETYTASKEFQIWKDRQLASIQKILATSEDPEEIARFINICKLENAEPVKANKTSKLDALATSVKGSGSGPNLNSKYKFTVSQIEKMSRTDPTWFEKNEDAIIEARNSGQILDDVTRHNSVFDV
jgi:hypothetical protein